jgi:hypothetical protein
VCGGVRCRVQGLAAAAAKAGWLAGWLMAAGHPAGTGMVECGRPLRSHAILAGRQQASASARIPTQL